MTIAYETAPNRLGPSLMRYIEHGLLPGGFLTAMLENDLVGAAKLADEYNVLILGDIILWIVENLPLESHGSPEAVSKWICEHCARAS